MQVSFSQKDVSYSSIHCGLCYGSSCYIRFFDSLAGLCTERLLTPGSRRNKYRITEVTYQSQTGKNQILQLKSDQEISEVEKRLKMLTGALSRRQGSNPSWVVQQEASLKRPGSEGDQTSCKKIKF